MYGGRVTHTLQTREGWNYDIDIYLKFFVVLLTKQSTTRSRVEWRQCVDWYELRIDTKTLNARANPQIDVTQSPTGSQCRSCRPIPSKYPTAPATSHLTSISFLHFLIHSTTSTPLTAASFRHRAVPPFTYLLSPSTLPLLFLSPPSILHSL